MARFGTRGIRINRYADDDRHLNDEDFAATRTMGDKVKGRIESQVPWLNFSARHIGPRKEDIDEMLKAVGAKSMDDFINQVVPQDVRQARPWATVEDNAMSEKHLRYRFIGLSRRADPSTVWLNGHGYYPVETPAVIRRNLLENPGWYTSYTPYQAEISQGRLESLLNFQTMVSDLTGLPVANASLLDAGTAAAEAMAMSINCLSSEDLQKPNKTYLVDYGVYDSTYQVMRARAEGLDVTINRVDLGRAQGLAMLKEYNEGLVGVMVQYPDNLGGVVDYKEVASLVYQQGVLLSCATDLLALTVLRPPGEFGADIAFGNSQRFGVPLGLGGPHAAFFATREHYKRKMPGRMVGVSKDRLGNRALRLALQTREQHIRREKATSNVCTSQALPANMAAMYAVYHGPAQLRKMALAGIRWARMVQRAAVYYGIRVLSRTPQIDGWLISDTICFQLSNESACVRFRNSLYANDRIGISLMPKSAKVIVALPTIFEPHIFRRLVAAMKRAASDEKASEHRTGDSVAAHIWNEAFEEPLEAELKGIPDEFVRKSEFLTHPVFNSHHSETEMMRYMHHLQSKDLSLVHSMMPLGSCTMKLNSAAQMELLGTHMANIHPHSPADAASGYTEIVRELEEKLADMTGMDGVFMAPNSGAQGEFAGLITIRSFLKSSADTADRDICLIPVSAHGTNPASAQMAGMRVVPLKCEAATGNLDLQDLKDKLKEHENKVAAIMITYPSTFGVFEPNIRKICDMVHKSGGQVYMDGANMNAQIGITTPGGLGADVCHLNLHKTFCIPHGGGGPGVGPVCAKRHLQRHFPTTPYEFLPHAVGRDGPQLSPARPPITSAKYGSASILPITWSYLCTMGFAGLLKATQTALLNANYLLTRLKDHYPILYTNEHGRCAHEFIIDARPFKESAGIEVVDIAKRLQDYGFHAPTMSWPVANTLMIEPTESESKAELDRFVDAMVSIRQEIREVEEGKQPRKTNVLCMAPHTMADVILPSQWDRPYTRQTAAYPLDYLREKKFWPTVTRVDDAYGDSNFICSCPPVEDTTKPIQNTGAGKGGHDKGLTRPSLKKT
ncbi:hypothetical protein CDD81_847 [Ophiocordyceps australis]|uniref:Glycine cleavage system P protein n=1 Tax=Ophiocordyceps australis TaxID=1399860 RepID=A0A2C5XUT5_9HYPO|nr:hypothetical protein CDD81_847 [Ophiocordyceps australis]